MVSSGPTRLWQPQTLPCPPRENHCHFPLLQTAQGVHSLLHLLLANLLLDENNSACDGLQVASEHDCVDVYGLESLDHDFQSRETPGKRRPEAWRGLGAVLTEGRSLSAACGRGKTYCDADEGRRRIRRDMLPRNGRHRFQKSRRTERCPRFRYCCWD